MPKSDEAATPQEPSLSRFSLGTAQFVPSFVADVSRELQIAGFQPAPPPQPALTLKSQALGEDLPPLELTHPIPEPFAEPEPLTLGMDPQEDTQIDSLQVPVPLWDSPLRHPMDPSMTQTESDLPMDPPMIQIESPQESQLQEPDVDPLMSQVDEGSYEIYETVTLPRVPLRQFLSRPQDRLAQRQRTRSPLR